MIEFPYSFAGFAVGAIAGLLAVGSVPATILALAALALVFRAQIPAWAKLCGERSAFAHRGAATVATGAFIGFAVSFSSVGAGAVGVTALLLLFPLLAAVRVVGTGTFLGSHLAARIPERFLRNSLAAVLLLAGTTLVLH